MHSIGRIAMEVKTTIPDEWYWELREKAAGNQNTEEEELRELIADHLGKNPNADDYGGVNKEFEQVVRDHFELEQGRIKTENIVAVASKMRQGMNWTDAVKRVAEEVKRERNVGNDYGKTIRSQCTREIGLDSTQDFKDEIQDLIDEFEGSN